MAYLRLRDLASGEEQDFDLPVIRVGRDPDLEIVPAGPVADVVSARHVRLFFDEGRWWIEDMGSSNGTFLNDERIASGERHPLVRGCEVRLGRGGPHFSVMEIAERRVTPTRIEDAFDAAASTTPMVPVSALDSGELSVRKTEPVLTLREAGSNAAYECRGTRVRIGRARDCQVQLLRDEDTSVSRHHAEIELKGGRAVIRDLDSRNGTFVNGVRITVDQNVMLGDQVELGPGGPVLVLENMIVPGYGPLPRRDVPPPPEPIAESPAALGSGWARRRAGSKGRPTMDEDWVEEPPARDTGSARWLLWLLVLIALGVGGYYGVTWWRDRSAGLSATSTESPLDSDVPPPDSLTSFVAAELARLDMELAAARDADASATLVDSLQREISSLGQRGETLRRIRSGIAAQLDALDVVRRTRDGEVQRFQRELTRASVTESGVGTLDSLRAAVLEAEARAGSLDEQVRTIRAANLSSVVEANRGAIGFVRAHLGTEVAFGSGFVVATTGFFVTSSEILLRGGQLADSVFVTLPHHRGRLRAEIVNVPGEPVRNVGVLQIHDYNGPAVVGIVLDVSANTVHDAAVMIGYGTSTASSADGVDQIVATPSVGVISEITSDWVEFDGLTIASSTGSPIFNRDGKVIAIHRSGPRDAVGLSHALPVTLALPLLPAPVRTGLN